MKKSLLLALFALVYFLGYQKIEAQCGTIDAGPDQTICASSSTVLNATVTSDSLTTTINWSTTASGFFYNTNYIDPTYTPSQADISAGTVAMILHVTNTCGTYADTMLISITPAPTVDPGFDRIVCGNTVMLNGFVTNTAFSIWTIWNPISGSGSFNLDSLPNAIYTASPADLSAGSVILSLRAYGIGPCGATFDTVYITFSGGSSVSAGPDKTVCDTIVSISGAVSGAANSASWSTSGTGEFYPSSKFLYTNYLPSPADISNGSVVLTLEGNTDSSCTSSTDQVTINFSGSIPPNTNAGTNKIITGSTITLHGLVSGALGGVWTTTGTGAFSPNNTSLDATYTPSSDDFSNGIIEFKLTTTGSTCPSVSDYVSYVLGSDYSISGTVSGGGNNLDNGFILVYKKTGSYYNFLKVEPINPADAGAYQIDSLSSGSYIICVVPVSSTYSSYIPTYSGNTPLWENASTFLISSSDLTGQDIALVSFVSAIPDWNSGNDTICGQVILNNPLLRTSTAANAPVAYATVYLKDKNGMNVAYTTSKPDGSYYFPHVKAENYTISVEYGGAAISGNSVPVSVDGNPSTAESVQLSVNRQSTTTGVLNTYSYHKAFVAPNPASAFIKISVDETIPINGQVRIIDEMGIIQYSSSVAIDAASSLELSTTNLTSGCYLIEIITDQTIFKTKFIKY